MQVNGSSLPLQPERTSVSQRRQEANRRNALKSTGPKSIEGKNASKWNAMKHGLLAKEVVISAGEGQEDSSEFDALAEQLQAELEPVGILEQMLVERIAVYYWRLKRAIQCETGEIRRGFARKPSCLSDDQELFENPELEAIRSHLSLPDDGAVNKLLRYESAINRQFQQAMNHLVRVQRYRKGDRVPPPLTVDVNG